MSGKVERTSIYSARFKYGFGAEFLIEGSVVVSSPSRVRKTTSRGINTLNNCSFRTKRCSLDADKFNTRHVSVQYNI